MDREYAGPAGVELARQRLHDFRRYASLVAQQETALDSGDVDRIEELARSIEALRVEIGMPTTDSQGVAGSAVVEINREAAEILRSTIEASERVGARLNSLKSDYAQQIRQVSKSAHGGRAYAVGAGSPGPPASGLDVRF